MLDWHLCQINYPLEIVIIITIIIIWSCWDGGFNLDLISR